MKARRIEAERSVTRSLSSGEKVIGVGIRSNTEFILPLRSCYDESDKAKFIPTVIRIELLPNSLSELGSGRADCPNTPQFVCFTTAQLFRKVHVLCSRSSAA